MNETEVKKLITSVLCSSATEMRIKDFISDFHNLVGKDVPFKQFGHPNLESYLRTIPDICQVEGHGLNAMLIQVVSTNSKHIVEMVIKQKFPKNNKRKSIKRPKFIKLETTKQETNENKNNKVESNYIRMLKKVFVQKERVKNEMDYCCLVEKRCKELIKEHPAGLLSHHLSNLYENKYKEELDPHQFSCSSINELCCLFDAKIFHVTRRPHKMDYVLYDGDQPKPVEEVASNAFDLGGYPPDVVILGEELDVQGLHHKYKNENYIPVKVIYVDNPSNFYFQYEFDEHSINRRDQLLYMDMQAYYIENGSKLILRKMHVVHDMHCVVHFQNCYFRATVIKCCGDMIHVFLFDSGGVVMVGRSNLYYLSEEFALLPKQAILASLSYLKPADGMRKWSGKAIDRFVQLVDEKQVMRQVTSVNSKSNKMHVILTDVTDPDVDVIVNDTLFDEGLATTVDVIKQINEAVLQLRSVSYK